MRYPNRNGLPWTVCVAPMPGEPWCDELDRLNAKLEHRRLALPNEGPPWPPTEAQCKQAFLGAVRWQLGRMELERFHMRREICLCDWCDAVRPKKTPDPDFWCLTTGEPIIDITPVRRWKQLTGLTS